MSRFDIKKYYRMFSDTLFSMAGLMLMNAAAQFVVYPIWNSILGANSYGNILYYLSILNIIAVSLGTGVNYARVNASKRGHTNNNEYLIVLIIASAIIPVISLIVKLSNKVFMSWTEYFLYSVLIIVTTWRYYADVEYRLSLNYKGYFVYYLLISIGYGIGTFVFLKTGLWPFSLLIGELLGLLLVCYKGTVFRIEDKTDLRISGLLFKSIVILVGSNLMSNTIFNGDRLILQWIIDGTAVSIYYLASLLGKTASLVTTPVTNVLMGYLARYNGKNTVKIMNAVCSLSVLASLLGTIACVIASYILLPMLYPQLFAEIKPYLVLGNAAPVMYCISNVVIVILLRFSDIKYQLYINIVYSVSFILFGIAGAVFYGIAGFSIGMCITSAIRLLFSFALGYKDLLLNNKNVEE